MEISIHVLTLNLIKRFAQKTQTLPRITLITLIYTDQESSIRIIFKFVKSVSSVVRFAFLCKAKFSTKRGRYNPERIGAKPIWGDENGKLRQAVGIDHTGIWFVPAVTGCSYGSRSHKIAGWTGDRRSYAKSRIDLAATNMPGRVGFSWPYQHHALRFSNVHMGGFPWPDMAGTSQKVLTSRRQRCEPQMEGGKARENRG